MTKEKSKLKTLIRFVGLELIMFGISLVVAAIGFSDLAISRTAIFLGVCVFFHLIVAYTGIKSWKKEQYPL